MRSRLWDMKNFSSILGTHAFQSEDDEEIEDIRNLYLGPVEDVDALREAM